MHFPQDWTRVHPVLQEPARQEWNIESSTTPSNNHIKRVQPLDKLCQQRSLFASLPGLEVLALASLCYEAGAYDDASVCFEGRRLQVEDCYSKSHAFPLDSLPIAILHDAGFIAQTYNVA